MRRTIPLLLAACLGTAVPAWAESRITVATGVDISTGDAQRISGGGERVFFSQTFEGLYGHDSVTGKVSPELALSHTVTPDGKVYTFALRPNVKWHDGAAFSAADVVFSWKRGIDPETRNPGASVILRNFETVEAVDDLTVRITLKQPDASLLENLGDNFYIVPKAYIEKVGTEQFGRAPIGTGPWKLIERRPKEFMEFVAFKEHWGRVPGADRLTMRIVADTQTRVAMLKTGEADIVTSLPAHLVKEIDGGKDTRALRVPTYQNIYINFSTARSDGRWNREARLALNHAIDRKTLIEKLMFGAATASAGWCAKGIIGCDISREPYAYDPKLARELLAKSGLDLSRTYRFVGLAPGRTPQSKEVVEAIAQYLGRVGVKTKIDMMEYGAWVALIQSHSYDDNDLIFWSWTDYNNEPMGRLPRALRSKGQYSFNEDPTLDALLDAANNFTDNAKRTEHLRRIFTEMYDDPRQITLWTVDEIYGVRRNIDWTPRINVSWPVLWQIRKIDK